ncbi:MAG: hypothetical protein RMI45_07905 [Ignisphaera sp.]|nr:hypothetical protein [Ignisphaera sp.]MDW8086139.1 hypothetical protein [Ignisphaera sp.]
MSGRLLSPRVVDRFALFYTVEIVHRLVAEELPPILHWDHDWAPDLLRLKN